MPPVPPRRFSHKTIIMSGVGLRIICIFLLSMLTDCSGRVALLMTKYHSELFPKISKLLYNLHMRRTGCARCNTASLSVRIRGVGSIKTSRVHRLPGALLDIEKAPKNFLPEMLATGGGWRKLFPSYHRHTIQNCTFFTKYF